MSDAWQTQIPRGFRRKPAVPCSPKGGLGSEREESVLRWKKMRRQNPGAGSEIRAPPSGFPDGLLAGFVKFAVFEHAAEDEPCADAETED
jgi:hypothetical protein